MTAIPAVWDGVDRLLDNFIELRAGDKFVVLYTPDSRDPAGWIVTTLKDRGHDPVVVPMAPLEDSGIAERLHAALPHPNSLGDSRLVVITVERDTMSHSDLLRTALARYPSESWISTRLISASEEFFSLGMRKSKEELSELNARLLHAMMDTNRIRITTDAGTDLDIDLDSDTYRWLSNRGYYREGGFIVMPPGEVATFPANINGVLVADGAFNINVFTKLDARLETRPVHIEIRDGQAVSHSCDDPKLTELLDAVFATPNARIVGELGFGTNSGVSHLISMNCHINERSPGLHIGFGQHNQSVFIMDYECDIHMDFICKGGRIHVGDHVHDLAALVPDPSEHPVMVMDEDIDGDCCGLWLDDVRRGQCVPRSAPPVGADR